MEEVFRPEPARNVSERAQAWIGWFGLGRLIASAVAVLIVCGGAYWLVRTPPPPIEAALPRVEAAGSPVLTLPVPVAAAPEVSAAAPSRVTVHVAGSVVTPGVYELASGARVHEAIDRAGGMIGDADSLQVPSTLGLSGRSMSTGRQRRIWLTFRASGQPHQRPSSPNVSATGHF